MELAQSLDKVNNRDSFLEFVSVLLEDKKHNGEDWENPTVERFLEAAGAWLKDSKRNDVSWKLMAEFLFCGKIYE